MSTQWGGSITEAGLEAMLITRSQGVLRVVYGVTQLGLMEGNTSDASCCQIPSGMTAFVPHKPPHLLSCLVSWGQGTWDWWAPRP